MIDAGSQQTPSIHGRRRAVARIGAVALAAVVPPVLRAQSAWPNRTIRFVVPFAPGGGTDLLGREIAQGLTQLLGQSVIVENRAGGGSTVGSALVARAAPDGYTFLYTSSHYAIVPSLYKSMPYDAEKDLVPVSLTSVLPLVLVVHPSVPAHSVAELIALSRRTPDGLSMASSGSGGASHLAGELFKSMTGANLRHVPYKGAGPAMQDLLGGHVQVMFDAVITSVQHVKSGRLRALATCGPTRTPVLPDLPTVAEAGVAGYSAVAWGGLLAPTGTPPEVIQRLSREVAKVLQRPDLRERQLGLGTELIGSTPDAFGRQIAEEIPKWRKVVEQSGARVD